MGRGEGVSLSLSPPAVLLAAAYVLLKHGGWCQGARAIDEYGVPCSALGLRAVKWDLEGALQRAAYCQALSALEMAVCAKPRRRLARGALADYNDAPERSRSEVLALLEQTLNSFDPPQK